MAIDTVPTLIEALRTSRLLDADQIRQIERGEPDQFKQPRDMAKALVGRGWLTRFQAKQVLNGRGAELTLGPYRLLERLGEGGMGQVYKALHQPMHRVVALKVVRPELVADPRTLKRFHREIQAAAQLSHPNIVTVYDAAEVGGVHFLAMEFIDGIDLAGLVKKTGAQPVAAASGYMLQAALGLHHAHEHKLIHRDVKPSNLLVSNSPVRDVVKLLDLGLARPPMVLDDPNQNITALTIDGTVVGTPDFMAPEQAKNSSAVDHRADLYSLGCTFYYVLAGRLPYPDGNVMEKLLKHQLEDPYPLELIRSDVPPALLGVLQKMMAKRPDDRYQSGAEIVAALEPFCVDEPTAVSVAVPPGDATETPTTVTGSPDAVGSAAFRFEDERPVVGMKPTPRPAGNRRAALSLVLVGISVAMVLALAVAVTVAVAGWERRAVPPTLPARVVQAAPTEKESPKPATPIPKTQDQVVAAAVVENASFVAVVNVRRLLAAPAVERHFGPSLQPLFRLLAAHGIDPANQWETLVLSADSDGPDRALAVLSASAAQQRDLAAVLDEVAKRETLRTDDRSTITYYRLLDWSKGKPAFLAFPTDTVVAVAENPDQFPAVFARFRGTKAHSTNDFLLLQLEKAHPDATLRFAMLGRFAVGDKTLDDIAVRGFAGELQVSNVVSFDGRARVTDAEVFRDRWRALVRSLNTAALFDANVRLPALLLASSSVHVPETRDGGYHDVRIRSTLTAAQTNSVLKSMVPEPK